MRASARGISVLECIVALAILTILATAAMDGGNAHARTTRLAQDAARARLAASSRLESFPRREIAAGQRPFDAGAADLRGDEDVVEVSPGLFEVRVRVRATSGAHVSLATRIASEDPP